MGGLTILGQMFFLQEYTWDVNLHQRGPIRGHGDRSTVGALRLFRGPRRSPLGGDFDGCGLYRSLSSAEILILPLFPAQPKLGPVYYPVTHLVPAKFPILIMVAGSGARSAVATGEEAGNLAIALVSGMVFIAVLTAVEWNFRQVPAL